MESKYLRHNFIDSQMNGQARIEPDIPIDTEADITTSEVSFDLGIVMDNLSLKRKLFHSEADFQFALSWEIQTQYPDANVRLEYCPKEAPSMHIDIIVEMNGLRYPIELKYKTLKVDANINEEKYHLKSHGAQDIGKYDCLLDIQRLEECSRIIPGYGCGYAVWMTNDPVYWTKPSRQGTMAEAFNIAENVQKSGTMEWAPHTGKGTMRGRETPISLDGTYSVHWNDYSTISDMRGGKLRYVILSIAPQ